MQNNRERNRISESGAFNPRIFAIFIFCSLAVWLAMWSFAAVPSSGTLSLATPTITYNGSGPYVVPNPSAQANGAPLCTAPMSCDDFALTIDVPAGSSATKQVKISVSWPISAADFDVYVLQGAAGTTVATSCATSSDPEVCILPAEPGVFRIRTVPFAPAGQNYTATVTLEDLPPPPPPPPPGTVAPRYQNYPPNPGNLSGADSAGEPSIGVDWNPNVPSLQNIVPPKKVNTGGVAFFTANLNEFRVSFDDCSSPARNPNTPAAPITSAPLWEDVTSPTEGVTSLDPIGFVDHQYPGESGAGLGRVFQSQLAGASSIMAYSDQDGNSGSWIQSQGSGQPAGADHQTVGGGPYNNASVPLPPPHPLYPHQVYYASQDVATAFAARSDTGGQTFGPSIPMWNLTQCGGLHGHIKVSPDGTVYVPNRGCGGGQGVAVSTDNGLTWTVKIVPGSTPGDTDPSVGFGTDSTLYFAYANGNGTPHVATSTNHGDTWIDREVSSGFIKNTVFPHMVGGDGGANGRAAFGFLGTTTGGNYQDTANFKGVWYFYIATTFDRGDHWVLVNATGNDPVQIGSICTGGTTCGADRNLLDFNDLQVDKEGRALAAYADGCVAPSCTADTATAHAPPYNESRSALSSILRQSGGPRLFSAFDSQVNCTGSPPTCPAAVPPAPRVNSVTGSAGSTVHLDWSEPDNGGSPLTGYRIYRRTEPGVYGAPLFTETIGCPACKTTYDDTTTVAGTAYFYKVTALNAIEESSSCLEFSIGADTGGTTPCLLPGLKILEDQVGDIITPVGQTSNPGWDLRKLSIAEPYAFAPDKLVFTLKVESFPGGVPPANTRWPIQFLVNGGTTTGYWVDMTTYPADLPVGSTVAFKYGTFNPTGGTGGVYGAPNARVGNADPLSTFSADGTITIVVPRSAVGNPAVGATLSGFLVRVRFGTDAQAVTPDNMPDSLAPSGSYTVVGNNPFCRPNTAPVAALTAAPLSGVAPLTVNFDASGSSDADIDPPADTIVSFTFTFGDGSPAVTQSTPTIQHTYNAEGDYRATVRVTDSRGKPSSNAAEVAINVQAPGNNPPVADLKANPTSGPAPLTVTFDGSGSTDPDFSDVISIWTFKFGDGTPDVEKGAPVTNHTYASAGTYTARLIVTDSRGATSTNNAQQVITVTPAPPTPTPTATPAPTPTPTPSGSATPTPTPTASPTPTATPTPTPAPTPVDVELLNISGRVFAKTGDKVGIGGFIVTGPGTKRVMARAIGPSLKVNGVPVPGRLQDPYLELHDNSGSPPLTNDNWRTTQEAEIQQTGLAPTDDHESAIVKRLPAGNYTAIIRGADNSPGIGVVELYDLSSTDPGELGNLSVRADVGTDDNVLIDGLILRGGNPKRVLFRALGPSVKTNGTTIPGALQDPTLDVYDSNGTLLRGNDNWPDAPNADEIRLTGLAPPESHESAVLLPLTAGNYTAIVRGASRTTGIALAEAYKLSN